MLRRTGSRRAAVQIALLVIFCARTALATPPPPPRVMTNPLRAHAASRLAQRIPAPNPDGGFGEGNPDGGAIIGGQEFWWIGASSPATSFPNVGVQTVMEEVDLVPPKGNGCFDCWTSETLDNGFWGQVGFAACNLPGTGTFVSTFYQIWDTKPAVEVLLVDGRTIQASPGLHTYAMTLEHGTTWAYSVDGAVFGAFDMGSASSSTPNAIATLCEEGDGVLAPFVPPAISVPVAMSLRDADAGSWSGAAAANVYNTADLSGAAGNLQDSSLADDALRIGGTVPFTAAGTKLWKGTAAGFAPDAGAAGANALAPPLVRLSSPVPGATVSGTVKLSGTVLAATGGPAVTAVTFFVENETAIVYQAGASSPPYSVSWDTTGVANGPFDVFLQAIDTQGTQTYIDIPITVDNRPGATSSSGGSSSGGAGTTGSAATGSGGTISGSSTGAGPTSGGGGSSSGGSSSGTTGVSIGETTPLRYRGNGCGSAAGGAVPALPLMLLLLGLARRRSSATRSSAATEPAAASRRAGGVAAGDVRVAAGGVDSASSRTELVPSVIGRTE